jgi:hypothetical protein
MGGGAVGKKVANVNHRIVLYPPHPGDYGSIFIGGEKRSERDTVLILEEMQSQILRHVDSAKRKNISIEFDREATCEFCGATWTEGDDSPHNGGCCGKDCEVFEASEIAE